MKRKIHSPELMVKKLRQADRIVAKIGCDFRASDC